MANEISSIISIIDLVVIVYIILVIFNLANIESLIEIIFSNSIIRLSLIILICLVATGFGNKKSACIPSALLLTIAYLLSIKKYYDTSGSGKLIESLNTDTTAESYPNMNLENMQEDYTKENDSQGDYTKENYSQEDYNQENEYNVGKPVERDSAPNPFRPNESVLGSGEPDPLNNCGEDFRSCPSGPNTDSGVAYNFNMA